MYKYYETHTKQDEIILQSLFLELIYMLTQDARMQTKAGKYKNNRFDIDKALKYIKGNLTEDLSLQKVADHVLLSPIHFHNCFKTAIGKTLHEYVEEQRIKAAINLLLTTELTLTEIAFQCGFSSQSYFSYVFKRNMGVPPRKYVEQINKRYEGAI
jgi:transcriptional regulator GlxA family with amidase domain